MSNKRLNIILSVTAAIFLSLLIFYVICQNRILNIQTLEINALENLQHQLYRESALLLPAYLEPLEESAEKYRNAVAETRRQFRELESSSFQETLNEEDLLIVKDLEDYRAILEGFQNTLLHNLDTAQIIIADFVREHPFNIKSISDMAQWRRLIGDEGSLSYSDFIDYEISMDIQKQNMALSIGIERIDEQTNRYESVLAKSRARMYVLTAVLTFLSVLPLLLLAFHIFAQHRLDKSISETRSRFFSAVSHELRTPMNVIFGLVQLMGKAELPERERERLRKIDRTSQDLLSLINDVLDYSKLDAGRMQLENKPYLPDELILHIEQMFSSSAVEKQLTLITQIEPSIPWVYGDSFRLQQVITNLMSNALKFTSEGSITLGAKCFYATDGSQRLLYFVKDTGIGIPPEKRDSLFIPFNQADDSTSRQFGGTGLGLTICEQFVRLMHGSIRIESNDGGGSVFLVDLPCIHASEKEVVREKESKSTDIKNPRNYIYPGSRILLVEDHPINREIMVEQLKETDIQITMAVNGKEGIEKWENNDFDLILMDIQMPGMNGLEAAREIRKKEKEGAHIPIIAMTAHAMLEDKDKTRKSGMDGHLTKPIILDELYNTLDTWLGSYRQEIQAEAEDEAFDIESVQKLFPEINIKDVLDAIHVDIPTYFDLLLKMVTDGSPKIINLKGSLEEDDIERARNICHTLKGTSGMLRLNELYQIFVNMEKELWDGIPPSQEDLDSLLIKLSSLEKRIRSIGEKTIRVN